MSQSNAQAPMAGGDRWEAVREQACPRGRRIIDVNHKRHEVRWFCDRCRVTHTYKIERPA